MLFDSFYFLGLPIVAGIKKESTIVVNSFFFSDLVIRHGGKPETF